MEKKELAGCVILQGDHILLLYRIEKNEYELPGGKVDEGEKPEEAAIREIKEELRCDVTIVKPLGTRDFRQNEFDMAYHWFLAQIQEGQTPTLGEPSTFSHYKYVPLGELEQHKLSANMQNLKEEIEQKRISLN